MLDAARKACEFVQGKERSALDEDEVLALALVRLLEVMGEAARILILRLEHPHPTCRGQRSLPPETG